MMLYFEKEERYFILHLYCDLLGDWIVARSNGRKRSCLGRTRKDVCADYRSAISHLFKLAHYRIKRRHYHLIKVKRHV